jgi:hypothetical protein
MIKQTLTGMELDAMVTAMDDADFGSEIEIEIEQEGFNLSAPDGYESDEDSLGELSTNDGIEYIDDSRDEMEADEYDGQPTEYEEWQDLYGGDDSIYEHDCDCMFDN